MCRPAISGLMTGHSIELGRRFRPAADEDEDRPFRGLFDSGHRLDGKWADLLSKRRVIVLAEAGSGKSSEFRRQRDALVSEGKFAFGVSVRDVAQAGVQSALPPAERGAFAQWRDDPEAECWLFIDSVDEAKDQGHHFESAVRQLEQAIAGKEELVHIYFSSRFTDWDRTADREVVEKWLALPQLPPAPPDLGEEVRATLQRRDKPKTEPAEGIAVVVLEPLSKRQVRQFAEGSGIGDVDNLLNAIEDGNLWSFAARPLDLGWIVDFWRENGRLGSLREMIEESIRARLLDPDPLRRKGDPLDAEGAGCALDRIGAGFVFCGKDTLRVPAAGIELSPAERSMPLDAILPDWNDRNRLLLLGRPLFDPATLGRARLHNDNEGTLRCYLSARWLEKRLAANCPLQVVHDLLFADLYGYRLVRPDMLEISAWLAGRVPAVADELITRSAFNLLRHGDPGSLPIPVRVKAFGATLAQIASVDPNRLWFMDESLKRFADPALDPHIADWWTKARDGEEARHLVLRLIHLGRQRGGLEVARSVSFDMSHDEISQLIAARALIGIGAEDDRTEYAQYVLTNHASLSRSVILQALDLLFPRYITVAQFFQLIDAAGIVDDDGHTSILPVGPELAAEIRAPSDLEDFLEKVVARSGALKGEGEEEHPFRDAFADLATEAALRLLEAHPDDVPTAVTDLVLLLHEARRHVGHNDSLQSLRRAFSTSPGRRRTSFWRAVERLRDHPWTLDVNEMNVWAVQHLGWPVGVDVDDLAWLIEDISGRSDPRDRWSALSTAHDVWRQAGSDPEILSRLAQAVAGEPALAEQLTRWRTPVTDPPERVEQMARMEELRRRNEEHATKRDDSWIEMIETLRADPSFFDHLSPQTQETVDSRLFHLWQFVSWRTRSQSRFSIDGLDVVAPIFGSELTERFGRALIDFAYARTPTVSTETVSEARQSSNFDIMALGGMSLAASTVPNWAAGLDEKRAKHAARLALIELNGLPDYLVPLALTHPDAVRGVLMRAVNGQLGRADPNGHGILDRLEYADPSLARLLTGDLVRHLEANPSISAAMLEKIVSVLLRAMPPAHPGTSDLVASRAREEEDAFASAYYFLLLFALEGDLAVDALQEKMGSLNSREQADLCCTLLPRLFGDRYHRSVKPPTDLSVDRLVQLLIIAFEGVRPCDDIQRPSGKVYSPELRDEAQDARNMIFDRITKTPGEATHAALLRLSSIPDFPIPSEWMRVHAFRRAEADAELAPWKPEDVITFERTSDRPPTTTADLQLLARRRIEAIEHDLINGRFSQGDTLQGLVDENAVQRWLATQFDVRKLESYIVQRETHYADEKEPDITLISRHSGVEVPIEIKVVDKLTVAQLETALRDQLCGQYLRHGSTRHGVLLLVYQTERPDGWDLVAGQPRVPFGAVLTHLQTLATAIRECSATGPQPIVIAIDVSRVVSLQKKRQQAKARHASTSDGQRSFRRRGRK